MTKFILIDGKLSISSSVDFHRELARPEHHHKIKGGGWWYWSREEKYILLYGLSEEFGKCELEDLKLAVHKTHFSNLWKNLPVYFSAHVGLRSAISDKILIFTIR